MEVVSNPKQSEAHSRIFIFEKDAMSSYYIEDCFDEADVYNMDQHKFIHAGHSGKGRSKREVQQRTNAYDPNGHTRKTMQKLVNNKQKQQQQQR